MLSIRIISVGKMKEKHYIAAFSEYEKRLLPYCKLESLELPEDKLPQNPSQAEITAALSRESEAIKRQIPSGAYTVAMCIEGDQMSSLELAEKLSDCATRGFSRLCFVIGSSFGLDNDFKMSANYRLSMSKMTFPHHLARVMLAEQIYRGIMVNEGSKYNK